MPRADGSDGGTKATAADEIEFELLSTITVPHLFSPEKEYRITMPAQTEMDDAQAVVDLSIHDIPTAPAQPVLAPVPHVGGIAESPRATAL